jgi:nucleotidyltransferase/DNA polymerase involved in DNA repair
MNEPRLRTIFHVDMDAFYTSVEQRDDPSLVGKPVIVGADPKGGMGRGVVAAASYEARRFGVHSAMPISRAFRACPQGVYLRGDMRKYATVSRSIMNLLSEYTDLVEPISIDEAFLDVSAICRPEKGGLLAREIKGNIWNRERLRASVGVASNKFIAKVASDLEKPDGLVVVAPGTEQEFLAPLPIERLWGVGPKTAEKLRQRGFRHIGELSSVSPEELGMGKHGDHLLALAKGLDEREVVPHHDPKSIGHETTFENDIEDLETARRTLLALCDSVAHRLRKRGLRGRTVTLKYRDEHFETYTRARTLREPTDDAGEIFARAFAQLGPVREQARGRRIRLLGVSVSKLTDTASPQQLSLFESGTKASVLGSVRDRIEERFGRGSVTRASLLEGAQIHPLGEDESEPERDRQAPR